MPIIFPSDLDTYFDEGGAGGLKVTQRAFEITDPRSMEETIGGEAVVATYGTNLWYGTATVVPLHNALQRKLEAKVRTLMRPDAVFYVGDLMDDPLVTGGAPVVGTVNATDNHIIRIDGLPAAYVLNPGVKIAFDYDGGRRALHETSTRAAATAGGQLTIAVFPMVQPGWTAGAVVRFADAARCKAVMLPKSLRLGGAGPNNTEGFTLSWRQTLERS